MDHLSRAIELARMAHTGQVDKFGAPYVEHLAFVANHVADDDAKTVAWLHDKYIPALRILMGE